MGKSESMKLGRSENALPWETEVDIEAPTALEQSSDNKRIGTSEIQKL
jgi:hypothetical protein